MRHVITGGSGFTGRALIALLAARCAEIVNFDLFEPKSSVLQLATFIRGDVRELRSLKQLALRETDIVYHLAARQFGAAVPKRGRDAWFSDVNVGGTQNVLDSMRIAGAHQLVFFSTDMTYGAPTVRPVPPSHPQNPLGPYGRAKLEAERRIMIAARSGTSATIFRPRLITGPGRLGILQQLFKLIRAGLPVPLIGSGRNRYQMVGVDDCASAAVRAADLGCPSGPFNLGSASPPSARELLEAVITHAKSRSPLIPMPAMPMKALLGWLDRFGMTLLYPEQFLIADVDILLDTADTQAVLGWKPKKDDISMMIAAYDTFLDLTR